MVKEGRFLAVFSNIVIALHFIIGFLLFAIGLASLEFNGELLTLLIFIFVTISGVISIGLGIGLMNEVKVM